MQIENMCEILKKGLVHNPRRTQSRKYKLTLVRKAVIMKWGHQGVAIKPMLYLSWYIGLIFHLNYVLKKLNRYIWRVQLRN